MARVISFMLTEPQLRAGMKDVTRRLGWRQLRPGTELTAVRKAMGLKKGERQERIASIRVKSVRRERLDAIDDDDVRREGFPDMTREEFIAFFCKANKCKPDRIVARIEFEKVASGVCPDIAECNRSGCKGCADGS
jgi:hypothetical protein